MKTLPLALLLAVTGIAHADLFVGSFNNNAVYRYDENTGALLGGGAFIASGSGGLGLPHRVFLPGDGTLLVASAATDQILRYDGATGAFIGAFIQPNTNGLTNELDYPVDMAIGPDGALYVTSQLNDRVLRFHATSGAFLGTFAAAGSGGLDGPSGLEFHNGDLYVAGRFSDQIHRFNGVTGAPVGTGIFATGLSQPFGVEWGADGNLYVGNGDTNSVLRFDSGGSSLGTFASGGGASLPIDLAFGPNDGLYLASFGSDTVIKYDATTGGSPATFVSAGSGGLDGPNFLTFGTIPEPSTGAYALTGLALLLRRRSIPA